MFLTCSALQDAHSYRGLVGVLEKTDMWIVKYQEYRGFIQLKHFATYEQAKEWADEQKEKKFRFIVYHIEPQVVIKNHSIRYAPCRIEGGSDADIVTSFGQRY